MLFNGPSGVSLDGTDNETTRTICQNFKSFFQNIDDTVTKVSQACHNNESSPMTHLPQCCPSVFKLYYLLFSDIGSKDDSSAEPYSLTLTKCYKRAKNVPAKLYLFYYIYSVAVKLVQYQIKRYSSYKRFLFATISWR